MIGPCMLSGNVVLLAVAGLSCRYDALANRLEDTNWIVLAANHHFAEWFNRNFVAQQIGGRSGHQDKRAALFVQLFEARGEVHRVTVSRVVDPVARAHVSRNNVASVDADSSFKLDAGKCPPL